MALTDDHKELVAAIADAVAASRKSDLKDVKPSVINDKTVMPLAFVTALVGASIVGSMAFASITGRVDNLENNQVPVQEVSALRTEMAAFKSSLDRLNNFAERPRFTQEDFNTQIRPMETMIDRHEAELNKRDTWMSGVEAQLEDLRLKQRDLEKP